MLWPESDTERASNSLRQVLLWLRRDLGEGIFLPDAAGGLLLDSRLVHSDLEQFNEAVAGGLPEAAVRLYRGPFLDGFYLPHAPDFGHWLDTVRDRLRRQYLASLAKLAMGAEEAGHHVEAVAWRRRQAAADPFSSGAALALLEALTAAGDRPGALEYAGLHEHLVRTHLETDPDPAIAAFVARLRESRLVASFPPGPLAPRTTSTALEVRVAHVPDVADPVASVERRSEVTAPSRTLQHPQRWRRFPFMAVGLVATVIALPLPMLIGWTRGDDAGPIILASGTRQVDARDPRTVLVACDGPACPLGVLPQNAFVVPKHEAYSAPASGTAFIAPVADGTTTGPTAGYPCCTTAVFEQVFDFPAHATAARITVTVLADNQASVSINGADFGRHVEPLGTENYAGPPASFSTTFAPDADGKGRLRVTLWDGGGALGLHFHAVVSYEARHVAAANSSLRLAR